MSARFDPSRLAIVDQVNGTTFVRGNLPLIGDDLHFAYDELKTALAKTVDLEDRALVVVSLIDNVGEKWAFLPEIASFGLDPASYPPSVWPPYLNFPGWDPSKMIGNGKLVSKPESVDRQGFAMWWPIEGLPDGGDPKTFLDSPGWDLSGLTDALMRTRQLAQDTRDENRVGLREVVRDGRGLGGKIVNSVIYWHCMNGADRTGALHGAYLMKAKGLSYTQALDVVSKATTAGAPNADYERLMQAYAKSIGAPT